MRSQSLGLTYAISAAAVFAIQDGVSKHLGSTYPVPLVTMFRYWAFALFVIWLASRQQGGLRAAAASKRPWLQLTRGCLLAFQFGIATFSYVHVGLAQTHTIFAATPLVVACLSAVGLGEHVGWRRWIAISIGFAGVLLIINPADISLDAKIIIPLIFTLTYAIYSVLTRLSARTDTPATSFFYIGVVGTVIMTVIGPFYWTPIAPKDWFSMILLLATGTAGHYLIIKAYDLLSAVVVQPMSYIQTLLVCMIGVFVYGELMTSQMLLGGIIIIAAGSFTIWREAKAAGRNQRL
ncbi:DMT family transporter (plasmid) [Agrobacterium leguminum]|uniref:DMT(Drug/metabolite transporter) superfamily permease n=1 Tax=Agrobacterium deltaense NCPPB 1641 TaxID=1183425 RepID=A0A1S7U9R6_9HYPH|nr:MULTISPECIES: DMT family transporter [Agrobacterium]WFS69631.1 DMT family transporter [Agrobacterium leguminum]CVI63623.1 DMT(Drug/metabolite transporter) superfamily permease [Agrobacterium deltaense NCPPB 1641]